MNSFKPGNWVRHIAFKSKHKCISINDGEFNDKVSVTNSPSFDNEFMIDYELWHPKVGEWCWFCEDHENFPIGFVLDRFLRMSKYNSFETHHSREYYKYCFPFIGELPTRAKRINDERK